MDQNLAPHYAGKLSRWMRRLRKLLRGSKRGEKRINWEEISEDRHEGLTAVLVAESGCSARVFKAVIPNPDVKVGLMGRVLCSARAYCSEQGLQYTDLRLYRPDGSYLESRSVKQWANELFGK